ncbi:hypothetical protein MCHI_000833 [Candidatus Magnetoovum chiemensis]|nr:hypothetical protein MCHI_000833 [Candidatus Magnetoovum chiemensis]
MMAEVCYIGSHGTSRSKYNAICREGFKLGSGRAGKGVYFWIENPLYLELAIDWCKFRGISDGVIIIAEIKAEDTEYLDLEDIEYSNKILTICLEKRLNVKDNNVLEQLYNSYVEEIERELGINIKILTKKLAAPPHSKYPMQMGAPLCCVVRDIGCIFIKYCISCEEV